MTTKLDFNKVKLFEFIITYNNNSNASNTFTVTQRVANPWKFENPTIVTGLSISIPNYVNYKMATPVEIKMRPIYETSTLVCTVPYKVVDWSNIGSNTFIMVDLVSFFKQPTEIKYAEDYDSKDNIKIAIIYSDNNTMVGPFYLKMKMIAAFNSTSGDIGGIPADKNLLDNIIKNKDDLTAVFSMPSTKNPSEWLYYTADIRKITVYQLEVGKDRLRLELDDIELTSPTVKGKDFKKVFKNESN